MKRTPLLPVLGREVSFMTADSSLLKLVAHTCYPSSWRPKQEDLL